MLIYRNVEGVHGQRKVGNPCPKSFSRICDVLKKLGNCVRSQCFETFFMLEIADLLTWSL